MVPIRFTKASALLDVHKTISRMTLITYAGLTSRSLTSLTNLEILRVAFLDFFGTGIRKTAHPALMLVLLANSMNLIVLLALMEDTYQIITNVNYVKAFGRAR
jgi:hypothetical protein